MIPSLSRRRTAAAASVVALLTLTACSGGSDDSVSSADSGAVAPAPAEAAPGDGGAADAAERTADTDTAEKAVISTGDVALESKDVAEATSAVQQVVDRLGGEVTEHETRTDDEGAVQHARMVVRVPSGKFHDAFAALEETADLTSSSSTSEDVTTEVIDNRVRIRAQRRSIQRIEVLLDRAQSIRDIMAIERQLARRQAELDSLEQRQAYLADQTSLSTITVTIARTHEERTDDREVEESGFLAGLSDGWDALTDVGGFLATRAGNLLPFAGVGVVLGVPLWLLVRTAVRRRPKASPDTAA